jgi:iron complex outermembrane receptor protein
LVIIPLYAADVLGLDVQAIGLIESFSAGLEMLMFYPAGMIMDQLGRKFAIVPCFAIQSVGMFLIPFTGSFIGLLMITILIGIGNGLGSGSMLTLGADLEDTDYELVTSFGPQEIDQTIWGLYGIANLQLTDRWRASLGLRRTGVRNDIRASGDRAGLDDTYTLGTAALDFATGHGWKAFLRADQNIRFATVDEHTNIVFGQPIGISNQPGVSWETGIEWSQRQASLQFTAYRLDLEDEISFNADTFTNTNLDRTTRRGFTVEGTLVPVTGWTLGAQYTFTDGTITDGPFDGNRIPLVARHTAQLHTRGRIAGDFILFAEAIYTGDQVIGGDYRNDFRPLEAFTLVNAAITWEKQGWRLGARVDNLLNEAYNASASVGFDESFTPQPAFFPAPERRLRISARYDF